MLSGVVDPASTAREAVAEGRAALDADAGAVCLLSPDGGEVEIAHAAGFPAETLEPWVRFPLTAPLPPVTRFATAGRCWCARATR